MKEIFLTKGMVAIVDDEDYEGLAQWKWYCMRRGRRGYVIRNSIVPNGKRGTVSMHRAILNPPPGFEVDHINGDGLDNRKENLRVATASQNRCNRGKQWDNTSGFKGVHWHKAAGKWHGFITVDYKRIHLGLFTDKIEAARAYNAAAMKLHGEFANLNQIGN